MIPQIQLVVDYANLSWHEALALPCDLFAAIRRAATIRGLMSSEKGRKYLADCTRLSQTEPDFAIIRSMKGYVLEE